MNREEILRKLPRAVSQETENVSMNETAANLLQQNKTEKVGAGRGGGRKISSGTIFNAQIPQEEQQSGPLWQCNNLSEFKEVDDGNTRKIWIIP